MANSGKWYLIQNKKVSDLVDIVREEVEEGMIQLDDRSTVPVQVVEGWGYYVIPVRLISREREGDLLWSDNRISDFIRSYPHSWEREGVAEFAQEISDEYEAERKNKIFIPVELRGCLLSTVQKAKNFLVDLLSLFEDKVPITSEIEGELDVWRIEIAEYDKVLEAIIGRDKTSG